MAALFFLGLLLPAGAQPAGAQEVSVTATLSHSEVMAGDMNELELKVMGSQQVDVPQEIQADGLKVLLTGQSRQFQAVNFSKVSSSVVYTYTVMPLRTGNFTIPSVTVNADGRQFQTRPLSFKVEDNTGGGGVAATTSPSAQAQVMPGFAQRRPRPGVPRPDTGKIAFGEINCPKKTLYVGEMMPVEIRYYFNAQYQVQIRGRVDFGSEGILVERFPDPKESKEERDGVIYNVLSFHSLLSAVKPGSIEIAPAKLDSLIQMPGGLPPGFDPIFQQLLGAQSSEVKKMTVQTAPLHLEVLALPKEGRPDSFSGAVGQFDIDAAITNKKPAPGDPVNLVIKISGKGNFKGMGEPMLTNTKGWRTYPPGEKLESSDELSYTGVKSFDFTLIAQQPQHASPGSEFSYFDPVALKYVTLTTPPMALEATPGTPSPSIPPAAVSVATEATPTPTPAATPNDGNPLPGFTLHSWKTPFQRSGFLSASLAMGVVTVLLATFLSLRNLQARGGTMAMRRKRQLSELWGRLSSESTEAAMAYDSAVEYVMLVAPSSEERDAVLARIIERRDLLKYGTGGSAPLHATERENLLETLRMLTLR